MRVFASVVLLLVLFLVVSVSQADPQVIKVGTTSYLKDAESFIGKAPTLPKITPTPSPSPSPSTSPAAASQKEGFQEDHSSGENNPAVIIHRSTMTIGQQIFVPTQYVAPQVATSQNGEVVVVPSTPTTFRAVQTGMTMRSDGEGNTTAQDTELSGFVNYGQPIRVIVPVQNQQRQPMGGEVIALSPNPVLMPVIRTIEITR
jgi:hypothetical protein